MALRFVHTADLHLDSPFVGIAGTAPAEIAATLRDATFATYDAIVDLCISERVDALLIAGDIYDGADRSLRAQQRFAGGLDRLHRAGIRSFVCHGNHDPLDGWEAGLPLPASCHRFGPDVEAVPFDPADPARGTVYGVSYPKQSVKHNLARTFRRGPQPGPAIAMLHCNVGTDTGHEPYAPCSVDDLAATGMDYWALGHVHTARVLRQNGPAIVYPGNPQGRHARETGPRGVVLATVDDSGRVSMETRTLDAVRWATIDVSIAQLDDIPALTAAAEAAVAQARDDSGGRPLLYRLALSGRGGLHADLQRPNVVDDVREGLNDASGSPFAWCARLDDQTRPPFDRQRSLAAGDFLGEVLALVDSARADPEVRGLLARDLPVLYEADRARRYLGNSLPEGAEFDALLSEAEDIVVEFLAGEPAP